MTAVLVDLPPKRARKVYANVSLRLLDKLADRLSEIATREGYRSRNELIAGILDQFVKTYEREHHPTGSR